MAAFSYLAKSLNGEERTGIIEAKDTQQLSKTLKEQGFILIKAEMAREKKKFEISLSWLGGVSLTEKLMFTRNLQVMVASGLALPRALLTLADQSQSKKFRQTILSIRENVMRGENFSASLGKHPGIFSELFQNMVKVGEESGTLDQSLGVLAQQLEKEHELKSKIQGALVYPAVIICTMIGIGILMLVMVVPKLSATFQELNVQLPLTTRVVMGLGDFLAKKWYFVLLITSVLIFIFYLALKNQAVKKIIDKVVLKIPVASVLIKKTNAAYTARTLSSLIAAGVPIVRCLEITAGTLGNFYFKKAIMDAVEKVRKGEKMSEAFRPYQNLYPTILVEMMTVGEETGQTSDVLAKLADFFENEVGNATKNLTAVIEPVLMLLVGGVIGFFAISMIQPMYSMLEAM